MTQEECTTNDIGSVSDQVIIQRYNGKSLSEMSYVIAGAFCDDAHNSRQMRCFVADKINNKEMDLWKKDGGSVFTYTMSIFNISLHVDDLKVADCSNLMCADFNIDFELNFDLPETYQKYLASFLLIEIPQDKNEYRVSDLTNYLTSDRCDLKGSLQRFVASEELATHMLETYGKEAATFLEMFTEAFPPFLHICKINSAKFYEQADNAEPAPEESDEAPKKVLVCAEWLERLTERMEKFQAESYNTKADRVLQKIETREEILAKFGISNVNNLIRAEKIDRQKVSNIMAKYERERVELLQKEKLRRLKSLMFRGKCSRFFSFMKWPFTLLILATGVWYGMQQWAEYKKQLPELLIKIEDYENCRKEFNEQIWPELMNICEFETPEIYEDVAIFRTRMNKETRSKAINYLQQCQKKQYVKLTSLPKNELPESAYDLIGYKLTMKKQDISPVSIVVEGNDPENAIAIYIHENWGVTGSPLPHPEKKNAVVYFTSTSFNDFIKLKATFENGIKEIHPGAVMAVDIPKKVVTVSFIDDEIKTYRFNLKNIPAAEKQAVISKILNGNPVDLGFVTGKFRSSDMTGLKVRLESAGFEIMQETEKDGVITIILQEKKPIFTYEFTITSREDPTPIINRIKEDKSCIANIICDYKRKTGSRYSCRLRVFSYLSEAVQVEGILKKYNLNVL